jgi:hypothetical protein
MSSPLLSPTKDIAFTTGESHRKSTVACVPCTTYVQGEWGERRAKEKIREGWKEREREGGSEREREGERRTGK